MTLTQIFGTPEERERCQLPCSCTEHLDRREQVPARPCDPDSISGRERRLLAPDTSSAGAVGLEKRVQQSGHCVERCVLFVVPTHASAESVRLKWYCAVVPQSGHVL